MLALRLIILIFLLILTGCSQKSSPGSRLNKLTIGIVSYGQQKQSFDQYLELKNYLSVKLNTVIELEPAYNEVKAKKRIQSQQWDVVFAPPGLAALAVSQQQYKPLVSLEGGENTISVIVVLADSSITDLPSLQGKIFALGQPGSATGYYFPLYNLYGLTLESVKLAPTPKKTPYWIYQQEVAAGALSLAKYNRYRQDYPQKSFRILHTDIHSVPNGSIIVSPSLDSEQQQQIYLAVSEADSELIESLGYLPDEPVPEYEYLIQVVTRVIPISQRIREKPARLYETN
ncbi:MAG: PhnD/SsuA/transferrin family substrate-binding protein [Prochloraceae cyanobacterium]|nr:PhnD/SsuA/transferrin family substrate-binding protein [Prochloraceae cyanobacterium]